MSSAYSMTFSKVVPKYFEYARRVNGTSTNQHEYFVERRVMSEKVKGKDER